LNDPALDTPGIGHNLPPLGEQLVLETIALETRIAERVASAQERAVVATADDAERATLLLAMMRELYDEVDAARQERKAPYLLAGRQIDEHYSNLLLPLVGPSPKQRMAGAYGELLSRLDSFRRRQEAAAAAERARLEIEADRQREVARAAERARLAAEAAQRSAVDKAAAEKARREKVEAELTARKAQDAAAQFDARAEAAEAPQTIHSGYGQKAVRRTIWRVEITDLSAALRHCLTVDQHKIREAVQAVYDRQLRAGVRELPGAKIITDSTTQVRK
jgi:hypothetical protein